MELSKSSRLVRWAYQFDRQRWTGNMILDDGRVVDDGEYRRLSWYSVDGIYAREEMSNIPPRTSLCRFFWRSFLLVPILWVPMTIVKLLMLVVGFVIGLAGFFPALPFLSASGAGISNFLDRTGDAICAGVDAVRESTFVRGIKAIKGRVCPVIEFKG